MPVDAFCVACDKNYRVSRKMGGKLLKCPSCGSAIKVPLSEAAPVAAAAKPGVRTASPTRPAPAKPRKAAPPPPEPVEGDYDLAALQDLAAAETAAEGTEERVYVPAPIIEAPAPRETRRAVRVKKNASGRAGDLTFNSLFLASPLFYLHVLFFVGLVVSQWGPPILLVFVYLYLVILILVTFFLGYCRALILTSKRWPVFGVTGILLPGYLSVNALLGASHMQQSIQSLRDIHAPEIVCVATLITLVGYLIHAAIDFALMARAVITGCYFILDVIVSIAITARVGELIRQSGH